MMTKYRGWIKVALFGMTLLTAQWANAQPVAPLRQDTATVAGAGSKKPALTISTCHIANLTLSQSATVGSGTCTATVNLSTVAPQGGATIKLHSSDANVTIPQSLIIPAGLQEGTFTVTVGKPQAVKKATLAGSYNGWMQAVTLTELPATQSFAIENLDAAPGNGCVLVDWQKLTGGSVKGYNVYRTLNSKTTLLTTTPATDRQYVDSGLPANRVTTCQYQVSAVDTQGVEHTLSAPVSVQTSATADVLNWVVRPPVGMVSEDILLSSELGSHQRGDFAFLLLDGQSRNAGWSPGSPIAGFEQSLIDTNSLTNGVHTVQFCCFVDNNTVAATSPMTIHVNNTVSNFKYDRTLVGGACRIDATIPNGPAWTVQISYSSGAVIRTWQGSGPLVHLAWDGKDNAGHALAHDDYDITVSAQIGGDKGKATGNMHILYGLADLSVP